MYVYIYIYIYIYSVPRVKPQAELSEEFARWGNPIPTKSKNMARFKVHGNQTQRDLVAELHMSCYNQCHATSG